MAELIPFPAVRRTGYIRRQAHYLASLRPDVAEKQLSEALRVQRQTMRRRGFAADTVTAELEGLERAIRARLWHAVLLGGGDAA